MDGSPKTIQYAYDSAGNRAYMIDPDGGRFTYAYDANGQLTSLINPQQERTSFVYDAIGQRTVKLLANGTRASYSYDANGNTTQVANLKSDNTTISSFDYQYNANNNRTTIAEEDGSVTTYLYDAANQFVGEHRTGTNPYRNTFAYDSVQSRLVNDQNGSRTTSTYDVANQLVTSLDSTGTTTYTFDADGNQQLVLKPNGDRTSTIWDYENKSTLVELPSSVRNTMTYNPDGLRVELQDSTGTKRFLWDNQAYLGETDETNTTQVIYTQEPTRYGNLISQYRKTGALWVPSYYHQDALGSTMQLTDSTETTLNTYQYNGWGELLSTTGTTNNPFQFTGIVGYYYDEETEALYIRARTYQPTLGRWWSADPLGFVDGVNLYGVYFAPNSTDPSGKQKKPAFAPFPACCVHTRVCSCIFTIRQEEIVEAQLCPVEIKKPSINQNALSMKVHISRSIQACCSKKKPWYGLPNYRCTPWQSHAMSGGCSDTSVTPDCTRRMGEVYKAVGEAIYGGGNNSSTEDVSNLCEDFCECYFPSNANSQKDCKGIAFCETLIKMVENEIQEN